MPKEEVELFISIGDPVTRERSLIQMGQCINCKSLDNRISVFILIETLRNLGEVPYDVYGVFSVQEEVGLRGAQVAAHSINPDFGFGLDTTIAYDVPGARPNEKITELGKGTAIKIMDSSAISDYRMVQYLKAQATQHNITWQPEILTAGGTDTAPVQRYGKNGSIRKFPSDTTLYFGATCFILDRCHCFAKSHPPPEKHAMQSCCLQWEWSWC